jgi:hypothetical protein
MVCKSNRNERCKITLYELLFRFSSERNCWFQLLFKTHKRYDL